MISPSPDKKFENLVSMLDIVLGDFKEQHDLSNKDILQLVKSRITKELSVPLNIFEDRRLGALECCVKFLKEERGLSYHDIAILLKRDDRTIWAAYNSSIKKRKEPFPVKDSKFNVPVSLLGDRKLGILESVVLYLRSEFRLRYSSIAMLLNRNQRTIWTTHKRALEKKAK